MVTSETPSILCVHRPTAMTGESPVWDARRGVLWWIDIQGQRLLGHEPATGRHHEIALPSMPGLVAITNSHDLAVGLEDGLWRLDPETGSASRTVAVEADDHRTRLNDGKPDRQGRLWFGTMDKTGSGARIGSLYCRHTDGRVEQIESGVGTPNSIAVSPDGGTLYFADSTLRQIRCFDLDQVSGTLANSRVLVEYPAGSSPDGAAIDVEGGLWVAVVGAARLDRFHPDGHLDRSIALPVTRPTMPAFGGRDMRTLFVTSQRRFLDFEQLRQQPLAGQLLALDAGVAGAMPNICQLDLAHT